MASLRIARIATGKKRIIKIGGAYHGWSDQMVYGLKIPGSRALLESHGIRGAYAATDEVRPNDLDMLERMLRRNKLRAARRQSSWAVVSKAAPGPSATNITRASGSVRPVRRALMIFDEVVTGFRVALSGAQGYFDVVPDLTIFGKIVAGGYPSAGGVGVSGGMPSLWRRAWPPASTGPMWAAPWRPIPCRAWRATRPSGRSSAPTPARLPAAWATACVTASSPLIQQYGLPFVAYNQGPSSTWSAPAP